MTTRKAGQEGRPQATSAHPLNKIDNLGHVLGHAREGIGHANAEGVHVGDELGLVSAGRWRAVTGGDGR